MLAELRITGTDEIDADDLAAFFETCTALRTADVTGSAWDAGPSPLRVVLTAPTETLERIVIRKCDVSLRGHAPVQRYDTVKTLVLVNCHGPEPGLSTVLAHFPRLEELDIRRYKTLAARLPIQAPPPPAVPLAKLARLTVREHKGYFAAFGLRLAACAPNITHLSLHSCARLDDGALMRFVVGCPHVRHIDVVGCPDLSDEGMVGAVYGWPELDEIEATRSRFATRNTLRAIAETIAVPRAVRLDGYRAVNADYAEDAFAIVRRGAAHLHTFGLTLADGFPKGRLVDLLAAHCPNLEVLSLAGPAVSPELTDEALVALAAGCPRLLMLYLADVPHVTPVGILAVVEGCPRLRTISAENVADFDVPSAKRLLYEFPNLKSLDLYGLPYEVRAAVSELVDDAEQSGRNVPYVSVERSMAETQLLRRTGE